MITAVRHIPYGHHQQAAGSMVGIRHLSFSYAYLTVPLAFVVFEMVSIFIILLPTNMLPPVRCPSIPPQLLGFVSLLKQTLMILNTKRTAPITLCKCNKLV